MTYLYMHELFFFLQELRKTESSLRTERDQFRDQATANKHEVDKLRGIFNFGSLEIWIFFKRACPLYLTVLFSIGVFIQVILVNSSVMQMRFKQN